MSSLAATRADGYYQPPEFDPQKHKTLNKFHGTHRLGDRAKRIHEGILVVRFEMPFKIWCLGCNQIVAKGVRFNADKKCIGYFHSSKILEFSMKCYWCPQRFVIKADPETAEYICMEGCRRKVETYATEAIEGVHFRSPEELKEIDEDPLLRLELREADRQKADKASSRMEQLVEDQGTRFKDDADLNRSLRRKFRAVKKHDEITKTNQRAVKKQDIKEQLTENLRQSILRRRRM
eukprot:Protomagalhaensia_sp_Gyna_25__5210@NODE_629_length_2967_cov_192_706967_g488_i0_p2_GENE_NODE_629_length_2967_cov_192_706967_g488_i0NODE_629_length_2967_cov_192_706967_g488_i0_p2_ORF_typecomplete_len235_score59_99DUF572/PF04502_13/2_5e52DUF866/PF05907_13/0_023Benyvirus_14KDa/PF07255_11/0_027DUF4429/PF14472_6/0_15ActivatorTraM/PF11657_8/1_1Bud13/PF09736_9/1_3_NODE_629_length_2967_cov_192_706967_g488_i07011405